MGTNRILSQFKSFINDKDVEKLRNQFELSFASINPVVKTGVWNIVLYNACALNQWVLTKEQLTAINRFLASVKLSTNKKLRYQLSQFASQYFAVLNSKLKTWYGLPVPFVEIMTATAYGLPPFRKYDSAE